MAKWIIRKGYTFHGKMSDPLTEGAVIDDAIEDIKGQEYKLEAVPEVEAQPEAEVEEPADIVEADEEVVDDGGRETAGDADGTGPDADDGPTEAAAGGGREA